MRCSWIPNNGAGSRLLWSLWLLNLGAVRRSEAEYKADKSVVRRNRKMPQSSTKVSIPDFNATIGWAFVLPIEEKFTAQSDQEFQIAAVGKSLTGLFSL